MIEPKYVLPSSSYVRDLELSWFISRQNVCIQVTKFLIKSVGVCLLKYYFLACEYAEREEQTLQWSWPIDKLQKSFSKH